MALTDKLSKPKLEVNTQTKLQEKEDSLNQAAKDLLEQLPDHAGQLVHSLTKQYQQPLWQTTCGMLLALHLEGRMSEFRIDPAWKQGFKTHELQCQYKPCSKKFPPRHLGQLYCSNDCGLLDAGVIPISRGSVKDAVNTRPKFDTNKPTTSADWADSTEDSPEVA
jgi:hypothetical protein